MKKINLLISGLLLFSLCSCSNALPISSISTPNDSLPNTSEPDMSTSMIVKKEIYLDMTSGAFPLLESFVSSSDINQWQKFYTFKEFSSFHKRLLSFDELIVKDNLKHQLKEIEEELSHCEHGSIFLVAGTFGTSDTIKFECRGNQFICNVHAPYIATSGLRNLFIAFVIESKTKNGLSNVEYLVNRIIESAR